MSSKACKFECSAMLTWDTKIGKFVEPDGTIHTKERCESLKLAQTKGRVASLANELANKGATPGSNGDGLKDLAAAIRELAAAIRARGMK